MYCTILTYMYCTIILIFSHKFQIANVFYISTLSMEVYLVYNR